jgi:hypothetical protein
MYSSQIRRVLTLDPETNKNFVGVYALDQLPKRHLVSSKPLAFVVNTDPASKPGEHWVAVYYGGNETKTVEYFDSYGMPPQQMPLFEFVVNNGQNYVLNNRQLQGYDSTVCGHYCIAYLYKRCRGQSMESICNEFGANSKNQPGEYDDLVAEAVTNKFNVLALTDDNDSFVNSEKAGWGRHMTHAECYRVRYGQCCCSKRTCFERCCSNL